MPEDSMQGIFQKVFDEENSALRISVPDSVTDALALTPSVEELEVSQFLITTISATISYTVFHAMFPCRITAFSLLVQDTGITASDTDYWTINLRKVVAGTATTMATRTTQATGGASIVVNRTWNFDAATFTGNTIAKGDAVNIEFAKTASAANLSRVSFGLRYEPI